MTSGWRGHSAEREEAGRGTGRGLLPHWAPQGTLLTPLLSGGGQGRGGRRHVTNLLVLSSSLPRVGASVTRLVSLQVDGCLCNVGAMMALGTCLLCWSPALGSPVPSARPPQAAASSAARV